MGKSCFLVDPFFARQYARDAEKHLDMLRQIDRGEFNGDRFDLQNYGSTIHPFKSSNPMFRPVSPLIYLSFLTPMDMIEMYFQNGVPDYRLTAMALGCQVYRCEKGDWPVDMDALAPGFMPRVPVLPVAPNKTACIYRVKYIAGFERTLLTVGGEQDVLSPFREETMSSDIILWGLRFADLACFDGKKSGMLEVERIVPADTE